MKILKNILKLGQKFGKYGSWSSVCYALGFGEKIYTKKNISFCFGFSVIGFWFSIFGLLCRAILFHTHTRYRQINS